MKLPFPPASGPGGLLRAGLSELRPMGGARILLLNTERCRQGDTPYIVFRMFS